MSKQKLSIIFSRKLIRLKYKLVIGVWLIVLATLSIGVAVKSAKEKTIQRDTSQSLIVYYSRTGNTREVAHLIQEFVGGNLLEIKTQIPRPKNYKEEVTQNVVEQENHVLPELVKGHVNVKKYQRIFVGVPTWNMALPQAVVSFLKQNDFQGKTVIPFNTNGGYGVGTVFTQIAKNTPRANVLEGFSVKAGEEIYGKNFVLRGQKRVVVQQKIKKWLKHIHQL